MEKREVMRRKHADVEVGSNASEMGGPLAKADERVREERGKYGER